MGIFNKSKSIITINGKTYVGNSIQVTNNQVVIDGVVQEKKLSGIVEIKVEGNLASLKADCNVTVHGDVLGSVDAGNNVQVMGDVLNNVRAGNNVVAESIKGDTEAGNNINMDTRRNWF